MLYKYLDDSDDLRIFIKGTHITVREIIDKLGRGSRKVSDSDITGLISDPAYSCLKEEEIREALVYFENNRRIVLRNIYLHEARPIIEQLKNASRITEEDLMITINARHY